MSLAIPTFKHMYGQFLAFIIFVNSSQSSQKFLYEFGNANIGKHVREIGCFAEPFIGLKDTSIFLIIIMLLPIRNCNNFVDSKSSTFRIYCIKDICDTLSPYRFNQNKIVWPISLLLCCWFDFGIKFNNTFRCIKICKSFEVF